MKHLCCCNDVYGMLNYLDCQCCGNELWCENEYCKTGTKTTLAEVLQARRGFEEVTQLELPF